MTANTIDLQNQFLIAMPRLDDPNFNGSITYICQHNEDGAMGIVINKASGLTLGDIFEQLDLNSNGAYTSLEIMQGGPVQLDRGFVLHKGEQTWDSSYQVSEEVHLTTSKDILSALSKNEGPEQFIIALGYAGWGPGQLEEEIAQNAWLTCPVNNEVIFNAPRQEKYNQALSTLGLDAAKLSATAGHA